MQATTLEVSCFAMELLQQLSGQEAVGTWQLGFGRCHAAVRAWLLGSQEEEGLARPNAVELVHKTIRSARGHLAARIEDTAISQLSALQTASEPNHTSPSTVGPTAAVCDLTRSPRGHADYAAEAQLACGVLLISVARLAGAEHQAGLLTALTGLALDSSQLLLTACQAMQQGTAFASLVPPSQADILSNPQPTGVQPAGQDGECKPTNPIGLQAGSSSAQSSFHSTAQPSPLSASAIATSSARGANQTDMLTSTARLVLSDPGVRCSQHLSQHAELLQQWLSAQRCVALAAVCGGGPLPKLTELWLSLKGKAGLSSPSAAVRLHAIQLLQALFVSDPGLHAGPSTGTAASVPPEQAAGSVSLWAASRYLLLELAAKEADPAVLRSAVCVGGQLLARCASDCSARELERVLLMLALLGGSMDFQVAQAATQSISAITTALGPSTQQLPARLVHGQLQSATQNLLDQAQASALQQQQKGHATSKPSVIIEEIDADSGATRHAAGETEGVQGDECVDTMRAIMHAAQCVSGWLKGSSSMPAEAQFTAEASAPSTPGPASLGGGRMLQQPSAHVPELTSHAVSMLTVLLQLQPHGGSDATAAAAAAMHIGSRKPSVADITDAHLASAVSQLEVNLNPEASGAAALDGSGDAYEDPSSHADRQQLAYMIGLVAKEPTAQAPSSPSLPAGQGPSSKALESVRHLCHALGSKIVREGGYNGLLLAVQAQLSVAQRAAWVWQPQAVKPAGKRHAAGGSGASGSACSRAACLCMAAWLLQGSGAAAAAAAAAEGVTLSGASAAAPGSATTTVNMRAAAAATPPASPTGHQLTHGSGAAGTSPELAVSEKVAWVQWLMSALSMLQLPEQHAFSDIGGTPRQPDASRWAAAAQHHLAVAAVATASRTILPWLGRLQYSAAAQALQPMQHKKASGSGKGGRHSNFDVGQDDLLAGRDAAMHSRVSAPLPGVLIEEILEDDPSAQAAEDGAEQRWKNHMQQQLVDAMVGFCSTYAQPQVMSHEPSSSGGSEWTSEGGSSASTCHQTASPSECVERLSAWCHPSSSATCWAVLETLQQSIKLSQRPSAALLANGSLLGVDAGQQAGQDMLAVTAPALLAAARRVVVQQHVQSLEEGPLVPYSGPGTFERTVASRRVTWLLCCMRHPFIGRAVSSSLPPALAAREDPSYCVAQFGILAIHRLAAECVAADLLWQRPLLLDAAHRMVEGCGDSLWPYALPCAIRLTCALEGKEHRSAALHALMDQILSEAERHAHQPPRTHTFLLHLPPLVHALGLSTLRHAARIMPLAMEWLRAPDALTRLGAMVLVQHLAEQTWPRFGPAHATAVLRIMESPQALSCEDEADGNDDASKAGASLRWEKQVKVQADVLKRFMHQLPRHHQAHMVLSQHMT